MSDILYLVILSGGALLQNYHKVILKMIFQNPNKQAADCYNCLYEWCDEFL